MNAFKPKVVIVCGGQGLRLHEETEFRPKPLITIGEKPILWHIMKLYSHFGYNDFILCLGYKGEMIKDYFLNYAPKNSDFTFNIKTKEIKFHDIGEIEDWSITFADTGKETKTSERILRVKKFVGGDPFFLATYGDGLADVPIPDVVEYHASHGRVATLTGVNPVSRYGLVKTSDDLKVSHFEEKPVLKGDIVSAGFFVFDKRVFEFLEENRMLEESLPKIAQAGELMVYHHKGYFHPMDTYRDYLTLNDLWRAGNVPWKIWSK